MAVYEKGDAVEGIPVEVSFGKKAMTFYVHPEGAMVGDALGMQLKIEHMQRAAKRFQQIERKLSAGTIDEDEYEERKEGLDAAHTESLAALQARYDGKEITTADFNQSKKEIEKQYVVAERALLNQRDGEPINADEAEGLTVELEKWRQLASLRPVAIPFLRSCVLDWTYYEDKAAEDANSPLPVTTENISRLTDDQLLVAFSTISAHYKKETDAEKKLNENSVNGSQMKRGEPGLSPTGSGSMQSHANGNNGQPMSQDGESENFAAVSLS